jgi:hypothetical protein
MKISLKEKYNHKQAISRNLARVGYLFLLTLWLLALSLAIIAAVNYTLLNGIDDDGTTAVNGISSTLTYYAPSASADTSEPNTVTTVALLVALAINVILLSLFVGKHFSAFVKKVLHKFHGKPTIGSLFAAKFISTGVAFIIVASLAIVLPFVYDLLPTITVFALISVVSFGLQLHFVKKYKIKIDKVL